MKGRPIEVRFRLRTSDCFLPLDATAREEIINRIMRVHWSDVILSPAPPSDAARAEFADWAPDASLEAYEEDIAKWALGGMLDARNAAIGVSPRGGMYIGPGTAERISDLALAGSGWRLVAAVILNKPIELLELYVERTAP